MKNNGKIILLLIMLAGMIMQFALMFLLMQPNEVKWYDPQEYLRIGNELASGEPYSSEFKERNLYFSPGYPHVLAAMIKLVGNKIVYIRILHILLFPAFIYFLYRLGKDWKNEFTGLILALSALFYPFYIYVPLTLYPEAILLYLLPPITWLMLRNGQAPKWLSLTLASALIALAVMIRPTAIFIIPVFVLYVVFKSGFSFSKLLPIAFIICLIPTIAVSGWMLRNYQVHGKPVFSSASGFNLLMSYNENASIKVKLDYPLPKRIQNRLDNASSSAEAQSIAHEEALDFIKNNPLSALKLAFFKQLDLWNPLPRTTTKEGFAKPQFKVISAVPYLAFLSLGIIGFIKYRKDPFVIALLCLTILNCLLNGLIAVSVRYRLITDFAFILLAATVIAAYLTKKKQNGIGERETGNEKRRTVKNDLRKAGSHPPLFSNQLD
jgi:hypothetical protein